MDYHQDYSPLGIEHVLVFPEKFNAIFLVDWTGVKQNITTPFLVPSASVADGAIAYDSSYTFHFEQVKFSCYVEAVTHDISSSITETKFVVNSKSERIFILCPYDWMPLPCFLHHAYLS